MAGPISMTGGCNTVTITCTAQTAGFDIYMDFDNGANNPDTNQMNPVAALLTCNAAGAWEYMSGIAMASYQITTISCFEYDPG
uniref:C6 domain-containing protein n=1 Tax=Panagrolaimus sp. ES5 TaxID=591445 RepID=A0AC34FWF3_9BILA